MKSAAFLIGLVLTAAAAPPAAAGDAAAAGGPSIRKRNDSVDWLLRRAAKAFTGDNKYIGQVHLPVIAGNPNSGVTYGLLPVWLEHNSRHEIVQIFAPMITYNKTFGAALDVSYYYYPSADVRFRAIFARAQRSDRRASIQYDDRALFGGRMTLKIDLNAEADGGAQFYGVGPASPKESGASERLLEDYALAELGVKMGGAVVAAAGWMYRRTEVQTGPFRAPAALDASVQKATSYSLPRLRLSRDTRDLPFTPSRGSLSELFAEYSRTRLGSAEDYERYGAQWRRYLPTAAILVTAVHVQTDWSSGGDIPFTALAALGGPRFLRGYPEGRFQDHGRIFAAVEERWRVHSLEMIHALTEFQVAPFLETGTVFPSWGRAQARYVQAVAGVAMRAVIKPSVVGRVEIGAGREGPAAYVGIDYPF